MTRCALARPARRHVTRPLEDGPLAAPWVDASSVYPTRFEPLTVVDGWARIGPDEQRGGTYQADQWVHPPSPPGSLYRSIGCAYVDCGSTMVDVSWRWHGHAQIPVTHGTTNAHVEATALLHVDLANPLGGFGCWPSWLAGQPVWLVAYMGSPPELFGQPSQPLVGIGAITDHVEGEECVFRLVSVAPGRVLLYRNGVQQAIVRTAGPLFGPYDPLPIDPSLVASTLHGFELDAHIAYPGATECDGLTDLTITSYPT